MYIFFYARKKYKISETKKGIMNRVSLYVQQSMQRIQRAADELKKK